MTIIQKRKIIQHIVDLENDIKELKRVRMELATSGYSSASLSSTGGSKSYTRLDLSKVTETLRELLNELNQYKNLLVMGVSKPIKTVVTIYS
jgi:uncharacterized radical SAM superfamily protein